MVHAIDLGGMPDNTKIWAGGGGSSSTINGWECES